MPQACRCSRGTWTVPLIKCLSFCSCLECQALGPGDHCRFLTAELFCSFCLFLFLSEDFLFPAAATPHSVLKEDAGFSVQSEYFVQLDLLSDLETTWPILLCL